MEIKVNIAHQLINYENPSPVCLEQTLSFYGVGKGSKVKTRTGIFDDD